MALASDQRGPLGSRWLEPVRSRWNGWRDATIAVGLEGLGDLADLPPLGHLALSLQRWAIDRDAKANLWAYLEAMAAVDHERFGVLESFVVDLDRQVERLVARGGRRAIDAESERLAALLGAIVADGVSAGRDSGRYETPHLLLDIVGSLHEAELEVLVALETPRDDAVADQRLAQLLEGGPRMTKGALSASQLYGALPELAVVIVPAIKRLEGRGLVRDVLADTVDGGSAVGTEDPDGLGGRWSTTVAGRELLQYLDELQRTTD